MVVEGGVAVLLDEFVAFGVGACLEPGETFRLQVAHDGRADEATVAGDVDFCAFVHFIGVECWNVKPDQAGYDDLQNAMVRSNHVYNSGAAWVNARKNSDKRCSFSS